MRETGVPGEKPSGQGENQQQTHIWHISERWALSHCDISASGNISYTLALNIYNSSPWTFLVIQGLLLSTFLDPQSSVLYYYLLFDPWSWVLGPPSWLNGPLSRALCVSVAACLQIQYVTSKYFVHLHKNDLIVFWTKVAWSDFWVIIPLNFEQLEHHHHRSNGKSNVTGVLEKDESFKWGYISQGFE